MKVRTILFYGLYFILAFIFFALVLFPGEKAGTAFSRKYNMIFLKSRLAAESCALNFPAGLALEEARLAWYGIPGIPLEGLRVSLSLPSVIRQKKNLVFTAGINQGRLNGKIKGLVLKTNTYQNLDLVASDISIKNFNYQTLNHKVVLSFQISGRVAYSPDTGTAAGTASLIKFKADLPKNPAGGGLGLDKLEFDHARLEFSIKDNILTILKCSGRGPAGTLEIKGSAALEGGQALSLEGTFKPGPEVISKLNRSPDAARLFQDTGQKGLRVRISGNLSTPGIRFN